MDRCLCAMCGEHAADSSEHVVLNALGGRREVQGFLCEPCNNTFGGTIDRKLEEALRGYSLFLGCYRGDGEPVAALRGLSTTEGYRVDLTHGGRPGGVPGSPVDVEPPADGQAKVTVRTHDEERAAMLLYHQARRFGVGIDKLVGTKVTNTTQRVAPLELKTEVGGEYQFRCVAKMGLAAVARSVGRAPIDGAAMATSRAAVYSGDTPIWRGVDWESRIRVREAAGSAVGQHVLLVWEEANQVCAMFSAFGCLPLRVRLASSSIGMDRAVCHVVDPVARTHLETRIEHPALPEPENAMAVGEHATAGVGELLNHLDGRMREAWLHDVQGAVAQATERGVDPVTALVEQLDIARGRKREEPLDPQRVLSRVRELLAEDAAEADDANDARE